MSPPTRRSPLLTAGDPLKIATAKASISEESTGVGIEEVFATIDRHHRELVELKRHHRAAMTPRLPLVSVPAEPVEPPLPRAEARLRLDEIMRTHFGRSA